MFTFVDFYQQTLGDSFRSAYFLDPFMPSESKLLYVAYDR